jgi:hypothetical protein
VSPEQPHGLRERLVAHAVERQPGWPGAPGGLEGEDEDAVYRSNPGPAGLQQCERLIQNEVGDRGSAPFTGKGSIEHSNCLFVS